MLVVLDTNIIVSIVSAYLTSGGLPGCVLLDCLTGKFTMCVIEAILEEYERVLSRDKFRIEKSNVSAMLKFIRSIAVFVDAEPLDVPFNDSTDKKFYEVAKQCGAKLITGNMRHYPSDPAVVSARDVGT